MEFLSQLHIILIVGMMGETSLLKIATAPQIDLEPKDIQRVHRLGKRKYLPTAKPRPIIARFISYKKRNQFLYSKSKLKETDEFNNISYVIMILTAICYYDINYDIKGYNFLHHDTTTKARSLAFYIKKL